MLQVCKRKRFIALIIILVLVLAGCGKNTGKVERTGTNMGSSEEVQPSEKLTEAVTPTPIATPATTASGRVKQPLNRSNPMLLTGACLKENRIVLRKSLCGGDACDFRLEDLSLLDLSAVSGGMSSIVFDTFTTWPDKLPKDFDPKAIMETGKDPGLGIRSLHKKGIAGKGVNIAITSVSTDSFPYLCGSNRGGCVLLQSSRWLECNGTIFSRSLCLGLSGETRHYTGAFLVTALETGALREVTRGEEHYPARMLNPVALIEKLQM